VRRRKGGFASFLFYFMIAQLHHHPPSDIRPLPLLLPTPLSPPFFFSSFLGQLVAGQWFWRPPHSFAFYSTRAQYATVHRIHVHVYDNSIRPFPLVAKNHIETWKKRKFPVAWLVFNSVAPSSIVLHLSRVSPFHRGVVGLGTY
jgi:hypothetical protein